MTKYQILETNILSAFKTQNFQEEEKDENRIEELVDNFNIYWKNYQDKWNQKYWEVYESTHNKIVESIKNNESYIEEMKLNKNNDIFINDSISNSNLQTGYNENKNSNDENEIKNKCLNSKKNYRANSTNIQTKTLINLQDIDDELDKINEISMIKDKNVKPEKRRNCLECNIF